MQILLLMHECTQSGQSPLWIASFNGHQKCVGLLIDAGANVDIQNKVSKHYVYYILHISDAINIVKCMVVSHDLSKLM